ncbi:hypothetical protein MPER_05416, partial [Moniliophthora perniciosa FA553]
DLSGMTFKSSRFWLVKNVFKLLISGIRRVEAIRRFLDGIGEDVESIRRYADSKLITHLINGGKYGTGIVYYLVYFIWRHQGGPYNAVFAIWCSVGTIYSVYASAWDLLMDWSLLRSR